MSEFALLSAGQRLAGEPPVGFVNPWLYQLSITASVIASIPASLFPSSSLSS